MKTPLYAGQPNRNDNLAAKDALPVVRRLIFDGKYQEAQKIIDEKFISKTSGGMSYQTLGNLRLHFPEHENFTNYYRELNIDSAVVSSHYRANGVNYSTQVFSSFPDQLLVMRIMADHAGSINFSATLDRPSPVRVTASGNDLLMISGTSGDSGITEGCGQF